MEDRLYKCDGAAEEKYQRCRDLSWCEAQRSLPGIFRSEIVKSIYNFFSNLYKQWYQLKQIQKNSNYSDLNILGYLELMLFIIFTK